MRPRSVSGRRDSRGRSGFTLMELLTVMALIAIVFGLAVGSLARSGKAGALEGAARLARSHLLRARMLALSGGALSRVEIRPANPETGVRAALVTEFTRAAGTWHFDDPQGFTAMAGEGVKSKLIGAALVKDGTLGGGVEMTAASKVVSPPIEEAPSFDPTRGFALYLDVMPASGGTVARFGEPNGGRESFVLAMDDDGSVSAEIEMKFDAAYEAAKQKGRRVKLKTGAAVIEKGVWSRIGLAYDGVTAELFVNGVAEASAAEARDLEVAPGSALVFGGFSGNLDEAEYHTATAAEVKDLEAGVDLDAATPMVFRFDREGRLNALYHTGPAFAVLVLEGRRETVTVDPSGIVR